MPREEIQLLRHVAFEGVADVDVEVPAGLHAHLSLRGFAHVPQGGARRRQRIVFAHREVPGALDLPGVAAREVAHDVGAEAGGDAGRRLFSRRDQRFDAGDRIRRGHQRGDLGQHLPRQRESRGEPVGERALGNHRRNPRVARRGADDVPAGERGAPQDDPVRVDAVEKLRVCDGVAPILQLPAHRKQLARFAGARAEVPVVEHQSAVAGAAKAFGEGVETHLAHPAKAVSHHNHRPRGGG